MKKRIKLILPICLLACFAFGVWDASTVGAWGTGKVNCECDEYGEDWLEPDCYADSGSNYRATRYTLKYEDWELFSDSDNPCENLGMIEWTYCWRSGTNEIDDTTANSGLNSLLMKDGGGTSYIKCDMEAKTRWLSFSMHKTLNADFRLWHGDSSDLFYIIMDQDDISWWNGSSYVSELNCVLTDQWVDYDIYFLWELDGVFIYQNGELIISGENYPGSDLEDELKFGEVDNDSLWIDDIYIWESESSSGAGKAQGWEFTIEGLEEDTIYLIDGMILDTDDKLIRSDVILCKTSGYQDFPVWLIILLVVVAGLSHYTRSWILGISGIVICIVSYAWVSMAETSSITIWGASAFFLIIIAWIILSMIFREARKGV